VHDLKKKLTEYKFDNEFSKKLIESEKIFNDLYDVCEKKMEYGIGSYLISSKSYEYSVEMYDKQKLLYDKTKNVNSLLEIGTYMGHSLLIILLANPKIDVTCIDIDDKYAGKVTNFLQSLFTDSKIEFIKGNSLSILPKIKKKFDFFHIDGSHGNTTITEEFIQCKKLSSTNEFKLIFDDIDVCKTLQKNIDSSYQIIETYTPKCINRNKFTHIKINPNLDISRKEDRNFKFKVITSFIIEFPARLIRLILRKLIK